MPDPTPAPPSDRERDPASAAGALLIRASRLLGGSPDVEQSLDRLLGLLVPEHAAWSQVTLEDGTGGQQVVCEAAAGGVEHLSEHAPAGDRPASVAAVVRTGQRADVVRLTSAQLEGIVRPERVDRCGHLLGRPGIVLPLEARGGVYGSLTLLGLAAGTMPLPGLEEVVGQAALAIDAALLHRERSRVVRVLQEGLRPAVLPEIHGLEIAGFSRPADRAAGVGGDFYDLHGGAGDWTVSLGDVAGKGVEAAMLTDSARQSIRTAALVDRRPGRILGLLNEVLLIDGGSTFVTVVCGRLRPAPEGAWRLDVATAGHPPPLILRRGGEVVAIGVLGTAVGALPDLDYEEVTVTLDPGDAFLLFTDGVTESRDADGELFGRERVAALLAESAGAAPAAIVDRVARSSIEFGTRSRDDIAMLAVRVQTGP